MARSPRSTTKWQASRAGKTYNEIAQRLVNALAWGQNDSSTGRGGWYYNFNSTVSDGSTLGWDVLALADAEAAGLTVPAWVKTEFAQVLGVPGGGQINSDGSFDYNANGARFEQQRRAAEERHRPSVAVPDRRVRGSPRHRRHEQHQ